MGALLVMLSSFGFATLGVFGKLAFDAGFNRDEALFWRFGLALPVLSLVLMVMKAYPKRIAPFIKAVLLGMIGIGVEASVFFLTLQHLGAALTGIFLYLYPTFVALISHFFFQEKLSAKKWACVLLAFTGSVFTVGVIGGSAEGMVSPLNDPIGLIAGIVTGGWYALYILAGARLSRNENPLTMSAGVTLGSFITFASLTVMNVARGAGFQGVRNSQSWIAVAGLALFSTVIPFSTLYVGMKKTGAMKASLLSTLELVFTIALAALFLGEKLTLFQGFGATLILLSVLLTSLIR